jgi:DNA-binding CsgD family transcriptional regulator
MPDIALPVQLIDSIYEAALDSSRWSETLAEISSSFDGGPVALLMNDVKTGAVPLFETSRLEPWSIEQFKRDYSTIDRNPMLPPAMTTQEGKALLFPQLLGDRYGKSAIYNDLIRPQRLVNYMSVVVLRNASVFVGLEVFASSYRTPSESELARFESVARHLGRVFRLSDQLNGAAVRAKSLEAALDCLQTSVFLVDRTGRVCWHNRAAADLLAGRDCLHLRDGRLATSKLSDDRALMSAFVRGTDAIIRIASPSGSRTFVLALHRLWHSLALPGAQLAVFVSHPDWHTISASRLMSAFELTKAEARIALAVSKSQGIDAAAATLGLSPNTVKTTLQRVFAKTNTRTQAELVRLFLITLGQSIDGSEA